MYLSLSLSFSSECNKKRRTGQFAQISSDVFFPTYERVLFHLYIILHDEKVANFFTRITYLAFLSDNFEIMPRVNLYYYDLCKVNMRHLGILNPQSSHKNEFEEKYTKVHRFVIFLVVRAILID